MTIVSGGFTGYSTDASVYKYEVEEGSWKQFANMSTARRYHSVTIINLDVEVENETCVFPAKTTEHNLNPFKASFQRVWRMILGI